MDKDTLVSCLPLRVSSFHENLVASSLSDAIGSVVEFRCTGGENEILSGPSVLVCTTTGKWNGSIPTCIDKDEVTSSVVPDTTEAIVSTTTVNAAESEVESVLIVLWVTGGLLLVSLVVLMACILRSHKKQRRNRSERFPRGQGNPRHGGVNPTFSNYDEIWTWIPVLTDNAGHCRNQTSASARENSANQTNSELMRNLRLPTYREAISNIAPITNSSQNRSRPANIASPANRNNVPHRQNNNQRHNVTQSNNQRQASGSRNHHGPNTRTAQVHRTVVNVRDTHRELNVENSSRYQNRESANANLTHGSNEQHHYETIPADAIIQSNVRANRENIGIVNVTSSSGSALQQARDLVNQYCAHAQRPQPSAPDCTQVSREQRRDHNHSSRAYINPSIEPLAAIPSSRAQENRAMTQQPHRYTANQTSHDFRHSEGSRFEYYVDNGRSVRGNIVSARITEPPPPYSVAREPSSQARDYSSNMAAGTSSALAATSLRNGFECQYF